MHVASCSPRLWSGGAPRAPPLFLAIGNNACRGLGCALPLATSVILLILADLEAFARDVTWLCMPTTVYHCTMSPWGRARCPVVLWALVAYSLMPPGSLHCNLPLTGASMQRSVYYTPPSMVGYTSSGDYFLKLLL